MIVEAYNKPLVTATQVNLVLDARPILTNVNLQLTAGSFTCLCGPNGAGKTMLLKTLLGLIRPGSGNINYAPGVVVGYVPQRKSFDRRFPATVLDMLVANLRGKWPLRVAAGERERAVAALQAVGGESLIDRRISELSGGQVQRAFIARAMVTNPNLLMLDEPMAGVDAHGNADTMNLLQGLAAEGQRTIVLITHSEQVVRQCATHLVFLYNGQIVGDGAPAKVLEDHRMSHLAFTGHDHV